MHTETRLGNPDPLVTVNLELFIFVSTHNCNATKRSASMAHSSKKQHMEVQRALIDKDFDRYALSTGGIEKQLATLPVRVLEPLDAAHTVRKALWDARVHYNALLTDPFLSDAASSGNAKSVAYFISAEYELMQVVFSKVRSG